MRYETLTLEVPVAVAAGAARTMRDLDQPKTVQVFGTFSATLQLQGKVQSADAPHNDWVNIGAALTAPGLINVADANGAPFVVSHLRVNVTAFTSGAPGAVVGGFAARGD